MILQFTFLYEIKKNCRTKIIHWVRNFHNFFRRGTNSVLNRKVFLKKIKTKISYEILLQETRALIFSCLNEFFLFFKIYLNDFYYLKISFLLIFSLINRWVRNSNVKDVKQVLSKALSIWSAESMLTFKETNCSEADFHFSFEK